jgi:hypothetical protein
MPGVSSPAVSVLMVVGAATVGIGFFAAGDMFVVIVGMAALTVAAVLDVVARRR